MKNLRWFTLEQIARERLPGLPTTREGLRMKAEREGWAHPAAEGKRWRRRNARGGGMEFHRDVLPARALLCLLARSDRPMLKDILRTLIAHEDGPC